MKDAKGHGSNPRGGLSPTERRMAEYGQGAMKAVTDLTRRAFQAKYGATGGSMASRDAGQAKVAQIANQHGISGGPYKVQSLALDRIGQPWKTEKSYRNKTVAERVALRMGADGGYMRVKVR